MPGVGGFTNIGGSGVSSSAIATNQANNSSIGNWFKNNTSALDIFVPGATFLNKTFDVTGSEAAKQQFLSQWQLQKDTQAYNSAEAEKARAFEKEMSDTAYQRAAADLKAAGLNPWLAVQNGGQGASTGSGQAASSSPGSASMANNKLAVAAGLIATALRMFLTKGK